MRRGAASREQFFEEIRGQKRLSARAPIALRAGTRLLGWLILLVFSLYAFPAHSEDASPRDVSTYVTVTEIKETSVKIRRSKRVRFKVRSEITLKNTSERTILPPLRSVVNIIGSGCSDKVWTRAFSKVEVYEISQSQGIEELAPGQSVTFPLAFEKGLAVDISYEILTYGRVKGE